MERLIALCACLPFVGEFLKKLHDYLFCTSPHFLPGVVTQTTGETRIGEIEADWLAVKDMSIPVDYLDFRGQRPGGGMVDFRWYRGETKRVSIQGPLYVLQTAVAVQFVLIFGRGIPDNTCCFEVRTAAEYLTPACGEATLTGLGTADIVLAASQARYGVRLWNKSTTAAEVIYLFDSTHGALGFPLSNGDSIFLAWPESTMEIRAEAASGTPKIGYMTETK